MIEEILWVFLGIITGTITGLIPGIHANTIAFIALYSPLEKSLEFGMFVVAMSISHSFVDVIPNILLGAPSEESFLGILPGHDLLLRGKGLEAIQLTIFGGLFTGIIALLLMPFFFSFAINYGEQLPLIIPGVLLLTLIILLKGEKNKKAALIIIFLSGLLGIIALNNGIRNPIIALVIGFFAIPNLFQTIISNTKIPKQEINSNAKGNVFFGFVAAITSGIVSVFPGIGPSQATFVVKNFLGKLKQKDYLILIGGINTGNLFFSLLMLFVLEKTRTGMAVALNNTLEINSGVFLLLGATALTSIGFSAFLTEKIAKISIEKIVKVPYEKISVFILVLLVFVVFYFSGITGLVACAGAAGIASFGVYSKVKRSHSMAFLMIPTMLFYLGISF